MGVRVVASLLIVAGLTGSACGDESPAADSVPPPVMLPASVPEPNAGRPPPTTMLAVLPSSVPVQTAGRLPATTVAVPPDPNAAPVLRVAPIAVVEPCPESDESSDGGQDMLAESSRLEPMLGQVLAYGGQHPEQFGGYGLVWHGDDASVFVSFTSDLDAHRNALQGIVEHPDELVVCQVAMSGAVAEAVQATLTAELAGRFVSISRGMGPLEVTLAPNEAQLAGELLARYGDAIEVTVGALAYPIEDASSACPDPPDGESLRGLRIEIVAPVNSLSATGATPAQLTVELTNEGDTPISFGSGTARGTILDLSGNVVSSPTYSLADVGIGVDLAPGASMQLPMVVSTASCDPQLGYTLPAGDYQLVAEVQHSDGDTTTLHSPPTLITIGE